MRLRPTALAALGIAALLACGACPRADAGRRRAGAGGRHVAVDGPGRARAAALGLSRGAAAPGRARCRPKRHPRQGRDHLRRVGRSVLAGGAGALDLDRGRGLGQRLRRGAGRRAPSGPSAAPRSRARWRSPRPCSQGTATTASGGSSTSPATARTAAASPWRRRAMRCSRQGLVVNGLPIMLREPGYTPWSIPDLDIYYADCVIGGPGSFVLPVDDPAQLADAIRQKLVLEIAGAAAPADAGDRDRAPAAHRLPDRREAAPALELSLRAPPARRSSGSLASAHQAPTNDSITATAGRSA